METIGAEVVCICAIIRPKNISRAPRQPGKTTSDSRTRYASLSKRRLAKAQRTVPSLTAVASGQRGELDAQARTVILRGSRGRKFDPAVLHLKRQDRPSSQEAFQLGVSLDSRR
jgi:hypothetical protein